MNSNYRSVMHKQQPIMVSAAYWLECGSVGATMFIGSNDRLPENTCRVREGWDD
jgi:hypothetical protein